MVERSNSIQQESGIFTFLFLPSFSLVTICISASLFTLISLSYFQTVSIFCAFFLRCSLALQAMQLQVFSLCSTDCIFLLTASSENSPCPFTCLSRRFLKPANLAKAGSVKQLSSFSSTAIYIFSFRKPCQTQLHPSCFSCIFPSEL